MTEIAHRVTRVDGPAAQLGEGAVWDIERSALLSIDMVDGTLRETSWSSVGATSTATTFGQYIGAPVPTEDRQIAVITLGDLALVDGDELSLIVSVLDRDSERLNDASVDESGRVWMNSTSLNGRPGGGALYSWSPREGVRQHHPGMTLPNGMGWNRSGDEMFIADSGVSTIYRASFDAQDGSVGKLKPFYQLESGVPDGLCIDDTDCLWVAIWDGSRLEHLSPEGELLHTFPMPVRRPSSCAAVPGHGLAVTSAQYGLLNPEADAGSLFLLELELHGLPSGVMRL